MGTYIPNSLPRPIFAISHALESLWDGMSVSWQGFCATRLNIFKCLHNRTPEASLFGSSYCQDFPKYEADINTNCSHPPDRSAGGKEKKRKRKICLTSHPSSSTSLSREAAQTCSILLHRVRCKTGTAQKQHKMGRKPRQTRARNYISRCNALTDLISTSIFLEVWQQTHRWSGTSLNLFNFSLWILLSTMSSLLGSHSRVWDVRGKIFMWYTEFNRSTQGHMASLCCLYSHHPQLCHWEPETKGEIWDFL